MTRNFGWLVLIAHKITRTLVKSWKFNGYDITPVSRQGQGCSKTYAVINKASCCPKKRLCRVLIGIVEKSIRMLSTYTSRCGRTPCAGDFSCVDGVPPPNSAHGEFWSPDQQCGAWSIIIILVAASRSWSRSCPKSRTSSTSGPWRRTRVKKALMLIYMYVHYFQRFNG